MRTKTIAIIGSIAALSLGTAPLALALATTHHGGPDMQRVDRSHDWSGVRHGDRMPDHGQVDHQRGR